MQKLLGAFGGMDGKGATVPYGSLFWLAGGLEMIGGLLLILGLFTSPVAFILCGEMAVAYFKAHFPHGFLPLVNHGELAVVYCFVFLYLFTAGAGPLSLDSLIGAAGRAAWMPLISRAEAAPRLGASRRGQLSLGAVVAGVICFFLPWFQVSCGGQKVGQPSGWNLAAGMNTMGQHMAGDTYVFLVLLALLALLSVMGVPLLKGLPLSAAPRALQIIAGGTVAVIPLVELVRASSQAHSQQNAGLITLETQPGFWGIVVCGAVLTLVGLVGQPEKPQQAGGSPPSG
jgi:putative oxidoreductase